MHTSRRLLGVVVGIAGLAGVLLSLAGIVACWIGRSEALRRVDRPFDRADDSLVQVSESLRQVAVRLRQTQAELAAMQKREADAAAQPPAERKALRALSRKSLDSLNPQMERARGMLVQATEISLVANGVLDALAGLPLVERADIDTDRLKSMSNQLLELNQQTAKLANRLADSAPDADAGAESAQAAGAVGRIVAVVDGGADRIDVVRGKVAYDRDRIHTWINGTAIVITILLAWFALGQVSLLVHGRSLSRR